MIQPETGPPDNERGRPPQAASATSTPIKIPSSVRRTLCAVPEHGSPSFCPVHGCAACALERFTYEASPDDEVPGDYYLDHESMIDELVDETCCLICSEIVVRAAWAAYPGWECEMTCPVQHCDVCGLCGQSGRVCRRCGVCVEHEEQGGVACWSTRWSKARRREVEFYEHDLWNPGTRRWAS